MGWWKVEGTEDVIGDGPLDNLTEAVGQVVSEYRASFGRRPTPTEWEALLEAVLGADQPDERPVDDCVILRVAIEITQK